MEPADLHRVSEAIRAAEKSCNAEFICVLARRSSNYSFYPLFWATFIALLVPWPLIYFTLIAADRVFILQLLAFVAALLALSTAAIRFRLVPLSVMRDKAHRNALEQFMLRGVSRTTSRNGVMIFVSVAERWARILVDDAFAAKVPHEKWQIAIDALLAANAQGDIVEGFLRAIDISAQDLAPHFPPREHQADELPNRIYVI